MTVRCYDIVKADTYRDHLEDTECRTGASPDGRWQMISTNTLQSDTTRLFVRSVFFTSWYRFPFFIFLCSEKGLFWLCTNLYHKVIYTLHQLQRITSDSVSSITEANESYLSGMDILQHANKSCDSIALLIYFLACVLSYMIPLSRYHGPSLREGQLSIPGQAIAILRWT